MTYFPRSSPSDALGATETNGYLIASGAELSDIALRTIEHIQRSGIDEGRVVVSETAGISMRGRDGEIDTAIRDGASSLQVTVYKNGRTGRAFSQAFAQSAIERTVAQALAIAEQLEPDVEAGLPDVADLAWDTHDIPLFAPSGSQAHELGIAALEIEEAALRARPHGAEVRINEAGASSHDSCVAMATTQGFCRSTISSMQRRWAIALAERDGAMARDMWTVPGRRVETLPGAWEIGEQAVKRATQKLGAGTLSTRSAPVLIDAVVAGTFVNDLVAALSGMAQFHRTTFLPDALGREIMPAHVDLIEDPAATYGLKSAAYDSEGVAGRQRHVIEGGVASGLFLATASARKLGMKSTGNADGSYNLSLRSSLTRDEDDLAALWRRMGTGLWLTEFIGGGMNPVTGSFSKAASGFWVENGEVVGPVSNFTVAANMAEVLRTIVAIGSDINPHSAIRTGSMLIENMQIAGG